MDVPPGLFSSGRLSLITRTCRCDTGSPLSPSLYGLYVPTAPPTRTNFFCPRLTFFPTARLYTRETDVLCEQGLPREECLVPKNGKNAATF
jgi:hypothetical protein